MQEARHRLSVCAFLLAGLGGLSLLAQDAPPSGPTPHQKAIDKITKALPAFIKEADVDENGSLDKQEFSAFVPVLRKLADAIQKEVEPALEKKELDRQLKKYDKDGDGKLDDAEQKAMEEDQKQREIRKFDWDHDGKLGDNEKKALELAEEGKLAQLFLKVDTDGDGKVSKDEIVASLDALCQMKLKSPKASKSQQQNQQ